MAFPKQKISWDHRKVGETSGQCLSIRQEIVQHAVNVASFRHIIFSH